MRHRPKRAPRPLQLPSPFDSLRVFLPKADKAILEQWSEKLKMPQSRLMQIAFDNEISQPTPFNFPVTLPVSDYIEGAYVNEAGKILRFLDHFREGTGRDMLMLCRREIGIPDPETFRLAYRELLNTGMVMEIDPKKGDKWPSGYKLAVLQGEEMKRKALARAKRAEIERLEREAKELERGD